MAWAIVLLVEKSRPQAPELNAPPVLIIAISARGPTKNRRAPYGMSSTLPTAWRLSM